MATGDTLSMDSREIKRIGKFLKNNSQKKLLLEISSILNAPSKFW